jgi:hypothetical protein
VAVDTTIRSISPAETPARSIAIAAAFVPIAAAPTSHAAIRRSLMPVRSRIHWSDVSTIFSSSAFVRIRSGRWRPVDAISTSGFGDFMESPVARGSGRSRPSSA